MTTAVTVTASQVKELREKTGAGMMDAKNALVESAGDLDKAAELLRQKGIASAEKKSGRVTAEGQVVAMVSADGVKGVVVEVNCETDFVAKGDAFSAVVRQVATMGLEQETADIDTLRQAAQSVLVDAIASIKENITARRVTFYKRHGEGLLQTYIHTGGRIGVLLELGCTKPETAQHATAVQLAKDVCMQIASFAPEFVSRQDIPQAVIADETRIEMAKEDLAKKPPEIREKIVTGRVDKLLAKRVLLEQEFVKDPSLTIAQLCEAKGKEVGDTLSVVRFTRYLLGDGIEKKVENFAEEVAAQLKAS